MFENYKGDYDKFCSFNKMVINMPRHQFGNMNIEFAKDLAILLNDINVDNDTKLSIIELYYLCHKYILVKNPVISGFIINLFNLELETEESIKEYYNQNSGKARDFRHLVMIMRMWGMLESDDEDNNIINYDICKEFLSLDLNELEGLRVKMIGMDIEDNPMFLTLKIIKDRKRNDKVFSYKPAINILRYIKELNRPVSKFEVSNLLGIIIPECQNSEELYNNAVVIGKQMPANITEHQKWFFDYMNWKYEDGHQFVYISSQAPHFKFNSFLLFMKDLDLIEELEDGAYVLTEYSEKLLEEDIPIEVAELERYINIAEQSYSDKELAQLIIYNIKPSLLKYAAQNENFIYAMNIRSINNPKFDKKGKKIRNKLIAELAKVKAEYTCQISKEPTFRDEKGNNYVESHHIIEFKGEDGPDIVDNLLVISPFYHSLLHHACKEEIVNLYDHIRKNNIITIDLFKQMSDKYHCIEEKHLKSLLQKNLISSIEYKELIKYIA